METKVSIGGNERTVPEYTAFKAVVAGEIVARASDKFRELVDGRIEYIKAYREAHTVKIPKSVAIARGYVESQGGEIPDVAFDNDEKAIFLPESPTREQEFAHLFPKGFQLARDEFLKLIALTLADDAKLLEADNQGFDTVAEMLRKEGVQLLHQCKLRELVKIARVVVEFTQDQLVESQEDLGELRALLAKVQRGAETPSNGKTDAEGRVTEPEVATVVAAPETAS